jgi:hypothetical protein
VAVEGSLKANSRPTPPLLPTPIPVNPLPGHWWREANPVAAREGTFSGRSVILAYVRIGVAAAKCLLKTVEWTKRSALICNGCARKQILATHH